MYRFFTLTKALTLIHLRERMLLFWNFAFPVFLLVIYGAVFGGDNVTEFMTWIMPGVLVLNVLSFGLLSSSSMMNELRTKGVLRRLQASPVPAWQLMGAYVLVNIVISILQAVVVVVLAVVVYGVRLPVPNVLLAFPMLILAVLVSVALGQVVSGLAAKASTALVIGQVLYFGQMFITDAIMPVEHMPEWVRLIGPYLPGYAMAQLVREPLQNGAFNSEFGFSLLMLALYGILATVLAARLFKWEVHS